MTMIKRMKQNSQFLKPTSSKMEQFTKVNGNMVNVMVEESRSGRTVLIMKVIGATTKQMEKAD